MFLKVRNNLGAEGVTPGEGVPPSEDIVAGPVAEQPAAVSPAAQSFIARHAAMTVLVSYAKYLMKTGRVDGKDAVASEIGKIASAAMDAGYCTADCLERLLDKIKYCRVDSPSELGNKIRCKMREHILENLLCNVSYDKAILETLTDEEREVISAGIEAWDNYMKCQWKVVEKFQPAIEEAICKFIDTFKDKFDEGFVQIICKK